MKGKYTHIQAPGISSVQDGINQSCIWQAWHSLCIALGNDQRFQSPSLPSNSNVCEATLKTVSIKLSK
ncbi:MAG TPA: hypothetical protein DCR17_02150 [Verrucomicrobiales bacterium]|nr:hypothetical protein [Pedosphaera sp.]HAO65477.1 hypothetical protein [Verrucomicrobiales bacterium]HAQ99461.1 hypothetical protein [Verrucomicrobiales bacterium]HCP37470.1 hypothetical protein [Verrucomicrobiales bacterium]HCZ02745.1 hypothetical protein [Verrucomicrobiales bacterium]